MKGGGTSTRKNKLHFASRPQAYLLRRITREHFATRADHDKDRSTPDDLLAALAMQAMQGTTGMGIQNTRASLRVDPPRKGVCADGYDDGFSRAE